MIIMTFIKNNTWQQCVHTGALQHFLSLVSVNLFYYNINEL